MAGIERPSYYDLETYEGELTMNISLRALKKLCDVLHIPVRNLFVGEAASMVERVSPEQLTERIAQHLHRYRLSISEFENKVGFRIAECLERPDEVLDWNIDCLRAVCGELGLDWPAALP